MNFKTETVEFATKAVIFKVLSFGPDVKCQFFWPQIMNLFRKMLTTKVGTIPTSTIALVYKMLKSLTLLATIYNV